MWYKYRQSQGDKPKGEKGTTGKLGNVIIKNMRKGSISNHWGKHRQMIVYKLK